MVLFCTFTNVHTQFATVVLQRTAAGTIGVIIPLH